jgi:hypothetical protein
LLFFLRRFLALSFAMQNTSKIMEISYTCSLDVMYLFVKVCANAFVPIKITTVGSTKGMFVWSGAPVLFQIPELFCGLLMRGSSVAKENLLLSPLFLRNEVCRKATSCIFFSTVTP